MAALALRPQHRPSLVQIGPMVTVACSCGFSVPVDQDLVAETWDGHVWMAVKTMRPKARSMTAVAGDRTGLRLVPDGATEPLIVFDDFDDAPTPGGTVPIAGGSRG